MANSYFQFKEFKIEQEYCAMKVSTDACLLGALSLPIPFAKTILDIGTGTGLLALMLAQETDAMITAIEIDEAAFTQAKENFEASKWSERIKIKHQSVQDFTNNTTERFDFIICNPPFFENDLQSNDVQKNIARHSTQLSLIDLLSAIEKLLNENGSCSLLFPTRRIEELENNLPANLAVLKIIYLKDTMDKASKRCVIYLTPTLSKGEGEIQMQVEDLILKKDAENYTEEFKKLMQPFYLFLK